MSKASYILNKVRAENEAKLFKEAVADDMDLPTEINTTERMASLAGKLEHHKEADVLSLAALVLRHVRRREGVRFEARLAPSV